MQNKCAVALGSVVLWLGVGSGCNYQEETSEAPGVLRESSVTGSVSWGDPSIAVCWHNPTPDHAAQRAEIEATVVQEFHGKTRLRFSGWKTCKRDYKKMIRIRLADKQPWARVGPPALDPAQPRGSYSTLANMQLNPTPEVSAGEDPVAALRHSALHWFGHALGLTDEHSRADSPCFAAPHAESNGVQPVVTGPYDPASVMNDCALATELTAGDVLALQSLYGVPGAFLQEAGGLRRYYAGARCNVVSEQQLSAFGGAKLLDQGIVDPSDVEGAVDVGACAWPSGFYRASDTPSSVTFFLTQSDSPEPRVCRLDGTGKLTAIGSPAVVGVSASFHELGAERYGFPNMPCEWPDGYYFAPQLGVLHLVEGGDYCRVFDPAEQAALGDAGVVRSIGPSAFEQPWWYGRTYTGACAPAEL